MITYIKMKYREWALKLALYTAIDKIIKEKEPIVALATNLYEAFKDTTAKELQSKVITEISRLAHEQAVKEREGKTEEGK